MIACCKITRATVAVMLPTKVAELVALEQRREKIRHLVKP